MATESSSGQSMERSIVPKPKRQRGAYIMKQIDKLTKNGKIRVDWNLKAQPIGKHVSLFQHFIGYHTRALVPVSIGKWKAVPEDVKVLIFEAVAEKFDVESSHSKFIIRSAAKKWSDFKSILTRDYLYTTDDKSQMRSNPPEEYPFIDKDTWAEFVRARCTSEFQEISERNSEKAKLNIYPYKCARRSYACIEQELIKKRGLDPSVDTIPRYELWTTGRETDGSYDAEVTKIVTNINLLKGQVTQGHISPEGREDLLSIALGKEDHSGRIRGVGPGVGVKYFGGRRARSSGGHTDLRVNELEQTVNILMQRDLARDQQMKDLLAQIAALTRNREVTDGPDSCLPSQPSSNHERANGQNKQKGGGNNENACRKRSKRTAQLRIKRN